VDDTVMPLAYHLNEPKEGYAEGCYNNAIRGAPQKENHNERTGRILKSSDA
jgi:hypothetical protein